MGHDEHFLSRVSRLEQEHAELALGLYYDSELVAYVLRQAEISEQLDRVALSLDDPAEGPFVIVARNGHFVTCLGKGMRISDELPLVTRRQLDRLSDRIGSLRELIERARSDDRRSSRRLFRRVSEAGDRLTREEFDELAAWAPLVGSLYLSTLAEAGVAAHKTWERLEGVRNLSSPRHRSALQAYWTASWRCAHMTLLVGSDDGEWLTRFLTDADPEHRIRRTSVLRLLGQLGTTPFLARSAWLASKVPKLVLAELKRGYGRGGGFHDTVFDGLGLLAVGLRDKHHRGEVRKALGRAPEGSIEGYPKEELAVADGLREWFGDYFGQASEAVDELRERAGRLAVDTLTALFTGEAGAPAPPVLSPETAVAVALSIPMGIADARLTGLRFLLDFLPWVCRAQARDFYLAAGERAETGPWQVEDAIALVEARRLIPGPPPKRQRRSEKVSRNGPCPCGSGKKYKKCCGAV